MILLDTNLLTRLTSIIHPHGQIARTAVHRLLAGQERIAIVPQNLYGFGPWRRGVGQRPAGANGLGFSVDRASHGITFFQRRFVLLPDRQELPTTWHELVRSHQISGFRAHDGRLVAAMQCYGLTHLLTFNSVDFKDLPVIVVDPASV